MIGLTGGIGSGKSAAADEFARLGATVVDTDAIAHELTRAGGAAISGIRNLFGDDYIDASGAMDRRKIRELVFEDPVARQRLEALLHPLIREESQRRIAAATGPYAVHVVPLLIESPDYRRRVDRVLVIECADELRFARVRSRSGLAEDEVRRIIEAQASPALRRAAADDLVDNSGSLEELRAQIGALHRRYLALAAARR
ncbi:MAG TPA: dephospho-CoA kinase [Burkholderiales bacterium]|nr:dephospho-CoA kinase [Burkholderiales bacterium]